VEKPLLEVAPTTHKEFEEKTHGGKYVIPNRLQECVVGTGWAAQLPPLSPGYSVQAARCHKMCFLLWVFPTSNRELLIDDIYLYERDYVIKMNQRAK